MSEEYLQEVVDESQKPSEPKGSGYVFEGEEIMLGRRRGRPLKAKHHNPEWFPQQTKVDACTLYCIYGDFDKVSELTKVPSEKLRLWHQEPWWVEIQKQVYVEQNENLSSRINEVLDKSLSEIKDRLELGDVFYDRKTGEYKRKPVDTKTLAILFDNLTTKRQLVRGEPTSITSKVGINDRLNQLADAFEKFAKSRLIEDGVIIQNKIEEEIEDGNEYSNSPEETSWQEDTSETSQESSI